MLDRRCSREADLRRMVLERRDDPALVRHAATCAPCSETLTIARGLQDLAAQSSVDAGQSSPTASYLWWKAELLRQFDAQARVEEPVEIGERIGAGLALVCAGILLLWLWRQIDGWASAGDSVWAALPWLTTPALVLCTLLLGAAAAATLINLASWNRKE